MVLPGNRGSGPEVYPDSEVRVYRDSEVGARRAEPRAWSFLHRVIEN